MLAFALCMAGRYDGTRLVRSNPLEEPVFYRELRPISAHWEEEALAVNHLDRERLLREGVRPEVAMVEATRWIESKVDNDRAVLVAYPVAFDWAFLYWYFIRYA